MTTCAICGKRNWFWQTSLDSRFGFAHLRCIDERIRQEAAALLFQSAAAGLCWLIAKGYLRLRSQIPNEKTRIMKGIL